MGVLDILVTIDHEIAQLQRARALLSDGAAPIAKRKPGRPKKIAATVTLSAAKAEKGKNRKLSPEGRKRIAEAVKKRWAAQKTVVKPKKAPAAAKKTSTVVSAAKPAESKRKLSPESRKRIADAAKKRWAARKTSSVSQP